MKTKSSPLALEGGLPVRTAPFAPWPYFADDEILAATEVLRSGKANYWTGDQGKQFEAEFARFTGRQHAVAVANGTLALELALIVLDIGPGDEVVVPSRTFVATASCVVARGATPVVADVDPHSGNITAATIAAVLTAKTRAIIVVHLGGWPCDMDPILTLARERGLRVIEDCAQALGGAYHGRPIGSLGDLAAFSFCQDKILTTGGEGGMLVCDNTGWWEHAWSYKDHGKDYHKAMAPSQDYSFRWLHTRFGSNWRLTEMQSAIGRLALSKVPSWIEKRLAHFNMLAARLSALPALRVPAVPGDVRHAGYRFYVYVRTGLLRQGWDRDRLVSAVNAEGVPCFSGSCSEIYLEEAFAAAGFQPAQRLAVARELGETSIALLVHPTLSSSDMEDVAHAVSKVMSAATA